MKLTDLIKPKWKNSDPKVRLKAVGTIPTTDSDTLLEIIQNDDEPKVTFAAAEKLTQTEHLNKAVQICKHEQVKKYLGDQLDRQLMKQASLAIKTNNENLILNLAQSVHQEATLVKLIQEANDTGIQRELLSLIQEEQSLVLLGTKGCGKELAADIIGRLKDTASFELLAIKGGNKHVRKLAQKQLSGKEDIDDKLILEQETKLKTQLSDLEIVISQGNIQKAKTLSITVLNLLNQYQGDAVPYQVKLTALQDNLAVKKEEFASRQIKLDEQKQVIEAKEKILEEVKSIDGSEETLFTNKLEEIQSKWDQLPKLEKALESMFQMQFDEQVQRLGRMIQNLEKEKEYLLHLENASKTIEELSEKEAKIRALKKLDLNRSCEFLNPIPLQASLKSLLSDLKSALEQNRQKSQQNRQAGIDSINKGLEKLKHFTGLDHAYRHTAEFKQAREDILKNKEYLSKAQEKSIKELADVFYLKVRNSLEDLHWAHWSNKNEKERLIEEAQALKADENVQTLAKKLKDIQMRWKAVGPVAREDAEKLWTIFSSHADEVYAKCKAFYEVRDEERQQHLQIVLPLIERAEALKDSSEWHDTTEVFKEMQQQWKEAGELPREEGQAAFNKFHDACEHYFTRLKNHHASQDKHRPENQRTKESLVEILKNLMNKDQKPGLDEILDLQKKWKEAGPGIRELEEPVWKEFRGLMDQFFAGVDAAREEAALAKEALCTQAEGFTAESEDEIFAVAKKLKSLQGKWKELPATDRKRNEALWQRFRTACDPIFEKRQAIFDERRKHWEENEAAKEKLIVAAEALSESKTTKENADELKSLQKQWKEVGQAEYKKDQELWARFRTACDGFFKRRQEQFAKQDEARLVNLAEKQALIQELEELLTELGKETPEQDKGNEAIQALSIEQQLQAAFSNNFAKAVAGDGPGKRIKQIQERWKNVGPVPREHDKETFGRYKKLLDQFYQKSDND
ncbi:MAG: DUF349 domain-containing protein [Lentisphaeria bacterium]|nr:DUF349 domain-containing protein [Lentisphaeria bacterium]